MNFIRHSCRRNNEGAILLLSGDCQGAMATFQDALSSIKQVVNDDEAVLQDTVKSTLPKEACFAIRESTSKLPFLENGISYVYDRPLLLDLPTSEDLDAVLALYSASILFNLALSCHMLGRLGKESAFKRATVLYRMSMQLLQNCSASASNTPALLSLFALNNRAQIHYECCDYNQSTFCLKEMSRIMANATYLYTVLPERDIEGLLLNVMLLERPSAAQAA